MLRYIITEEKYNQDIVKLLPEHMKTLLELDFDNEDPLLKEGHYCYDEEKKIAYDRFIKNKNSIKEKNAFLKLLTRSAVTPGLELERVYYLSQNDIVLLPMATNNKVGHIETFTKWRRWTF